MTGDGGHGMPAPGKLGDDARAGISGRADNGDFHENSPGQDWYLVGI
jgi:hypothetical protein